MTPDERAHLAEQLIANPLWAVLLSELETNAIERLVYAKNEIDRLECQMRVQAVRSFRSDCEDSLHSNRAPKAVPA